MRKILQFHQKIVLILGATLLFVSHPLKAQWYQIVDLQFQIFLQANFPLAVQGDSINIAHLSVVNTTELTIDNMQIIFIDGIEAFQNLTKFSAKNNQFNYLYPIENLVHLRKYI